MHMAFLSRVFKNLQWYGMTYGVSLKDLKSSFDDTPHFLCSILYGNLCGGVA